MSCLKLVSNCNQLNITALAENLNISHTWTENLNISHTWTENLNVSHTWTENLNISHV